MLIGKWQYPNVRSIASTAKVVELFKTEISSIKMQHDMAWKLNSGPPS